MLLSILMASGCHPEATLNTAANLFGSVLVIALAKTFAAFLARGFFTRTRIERRGWRTVGRNAYPTLPTANVHTPLFLIATIGGLPVDAAVTFSQLLCIGLLILLGGS